MSNTTTVSGNFLSQSLDERGTSAQAQYIQAVAYQVSPKNLEIYIWTNNTPRLVKDAVRTWTK